MKRIIALIIIAVLIFTMLSCQDQNSNENTAVDPEIDTSQTETTAETEPERFTPDLPEADYEGYEFRALVPTANVWASCTFDVESESGDTVNDAIFRRNSYIEEKYNVVLSQIELGDFGQLEGAFKKTVLGGSDDFDICVQIDRYAFSLAMSGYILPADQLPYIDLIQPWYMHDIQDSISVGNKYYIVESNENMSLYECTDVLFFNKKLVEDFNLESPYDLVNDGTWTYDKFFDLCRVVVSDLNGDGAMTDTDLYGIASEDSTLFRNFWESSGIQSVVKNSDDMFVLNLDGNEKLANILEKAHNNLFGGEKIYFAAGRDKADTLTPRNNDGNQDISLQQFQNNLALFYPSMLIRTANMRSMETDFGILPYPKADETQSRYYVRSGGGWPKVVPSHAVNPERTSVILEALAAESRNTTVPAFKEVNLRTKIARDDESAEMLDLIFNSGFGDVGTFLWLDIRDMLVNVVIQNNYASAVDSRSPAFEKTLNTVNETAANLS